MHAVKYSTNSASVRVFAWRKLAYVGGLQALYKRRVAVRLNSLHSGFNTLMESEQLAVAALGHNIYISDTGLCKTDHKVLY
jgi:hypothetical protein